MFERGVEDGLLELLDREGVGCICYSPLAQGALTDKYLKGIPAGSRASRTGTSVEERYLNEGNIEKVRKLNEMAKKRGQSLAQMALAWVLRRPEVTSVLVGASRPEQLENSAQALKSAVFTKEELDAIDAVLA